MLPARKFVLDEAMNRYWADLEMTMGHQQRMVVDENGAWFTDKTGAPAMTSRPGKYSKQLRLIDAVRMQARLPHKQTWIEVDPRIYRDQTVKCHGVILKSGAIPVLRRGFLLEQHPHIETAFKCTEYTAQKSMDDLYINHIGMAWVADDSTPMPWPQYQHPVPWRQHRYGLQTENIIKTPLNSEQDPADDAEYEWSDSELVAGICGYVTPQVCLIPAIAPHLYNQKSLEHPKNVWKLRASGRGLWMLLAVINDLPVTLEAIEPSRGYVAKGSYKRFLSHTIVHLYVPQRQWRNLTAHALTVLRRRAHQVRGFWRADWRHPLQTTCIHSFDDDMTCRLCRGRKIWVREHQRGDTSLGFVTHDYVVHHKEPA
jgi:hypothetical protein